MTLLTKLQDSEGGLIGITEDNEQVRLGVPLPNTQIYDYIPEGLIGKVRASFTTSYWAKRRKEMVERAKEEAREYKGYSYINDISSLSNDYSTNGEKCFAVTSLVWPEDHEHSFGYINEYR